MLKNIRLVLEDIEYKMYEFWLTISIIGEHSDSRIDRALMESMLTRGGWQSQIVGDTLFVTLEGTKIKTFEQAIQWCGDRGIEVDDE